MAPRARGELAGVGEGGTGPLDRQEAVAGEVVGILQEVVVVVVVVGAGLRTVEGEVVEVVGEELVLLQLKCCWGSEPHHVPESDQPDHNLLLESDQPDHNLLLVFSGLCT